MARIIQHWAKRPFGYAGQALDRGQVVTLAGAVNDDKLVRLGYFGEVEAKAELHQCPKCGAQFVGMAERQFHFEKRHPTRAKNALQEDQAMDREEHMLEQIAPLG